MAWLEGFSQPSHRTTSGSGIGYPRPARTAPGREASRNGWGTHKRI